MSRTKEEIDPCQFCKGESYVQRLSESNMWRAFCSNPDCPVTKAEVIASTKKKRAVSNWEGESQQELKDVVRKSYECQLNSDVRVKRLVELWKKRRNSSHTSP